MTDTFKRLLHSSLMLYAKPTAGYFLVILMKALQMIPFHCLLSLAILCLTYINHTGSFSYTVFTILKWHHYICKQNQKFSPFPLLLHEIILNIVLWINTAYSQSVLLLSLQTHYNGRHRHTVPDILSAFTHCKHNKYQTDNFMSSVNISSSQHLTPA